MRRILFLCACLYFDLVNFVLSNSRIVRFKPFPGLRYHEYDTDLLNTSPVYCCAKCMDESDCLFVAFNSGTKVCRLISSKTHLTSGLTTDRQWTTYIPDTALGKSLCPDDFRQFHGSCYRIVMYELTWSEAKMYCERLNGHLVYITSESEMQFLRSYIRIQGSYSIGATDAAVEGIWRWMNGERVVYKNWRSNQPDNYYNEDYAEIVLASYSHYEWNDKSDNIRSYSICEKDIQFR